LLWRVLLWRLAVNLIDKLIESSSYRPRATVLPGLLLDGCLYLNASLCHLLMQLFYD
jgi:hypothetical protein